MSKLGDTEERRQYVSALAEWRNGEDGIKWKWRALEELHKMDLSQKEAGRLMYEFAKAGGEIDKVKEERERWRDLHRYHYDMRLPMANQLMYVETRFINESRFNPPHVLVVNIHPK